MPSPTGCSGSTGGRWAFGADFTVLDQSDGADLMNLIRERAGVRHARAAVPAQGHAGVDLLADRERRREARATCSKRHFPWCVDEADGIREVFRRTPSASATQNVLDYDDLLLFWKALATAPQTRDALASMFDHVLVDEYQDTNAAPGRHPGRDATAGPARNVRWWATTPRPSTGSAPRPSATSSSSCAVRRRPRDPPGAELPFDAADPRGVERGDRARRRSATRRRCGPSRDGARRPVLRTCLDEAEQCDSVCRSVLAAPRGGRRR